MMQRSVQNIMSPAKPKPAATTIRNAPITINTVIFVFFIQSLLFSMGRPCLRLGSSNAEYNGCEYRIHSFRSDIVTVGRNTPILRVQNAVIEKLPSNSSDKQHYFTRSSYSRLDTSAPFLRVS